MADTTPMTKSQLVAEDIVALMRARTPIIWIVTREERRVEGYLIKAAQTAGYNPVFWDVAEGVTDAKGNVVTTIEGAGTDISQTLNAIKTRAGRLVGSDNIRTAWIMRDLPSPWLQGPLGATPLRQLRNLAKMLPGVPKRENSQALILLSTESKLPPELEGHATVIEWPLPDRAEIAATLDSAIKILPPEAQKEIATSGVRDQAIDAAVGLSQEEANSCYSKSLVQSGKIDPKIVAAEKQRIIAKAGVLEWVNPIEGGLSAVGGLENLKGWLTTRRSAYSPKARQYGLRPPKGVVLIGIPGCGKSLTAKCFPTAWGVPLLKLDLGSLKGKFVGESEGNMRKALKVIEAIGRCVVWIDEIEKGMQGATGGSADGGVSSDQLGTLLTWLQDRATEAFVVATANDIEGLPPELLRKGRFDEIFYVGLPNAEERASVLKAALAANQRGNLTGIDLSSIVDKTSGFTGSEIAELVPTAMFTAFEEDAREITTADLVEAAKDVVPLSKSQAAKIKRLETWLNEGKARSATKAEQSAQEAVSMDVRQIEL